MYPITNAVKALFESEQRKVLRITGGPNIRGTKTVGPSDIVSVDDAIAMPASDVTIGIEPVQDLHGYDNPWPAGGGKNKFDESIAVAPNFYNVDGTFTNRTTDTRSPAMIQVQAFNGSTLVAYATTNGAYPNRTIGTITIDSAVTRLRIKHNGSSVDLPIDISWTAQGTFTISLLVPSNDPTTVGGLVIKDIQVEEGSTATPYAPYSNICPISGWTGANIYHEDEYDAGATAALSITWQSDAGTVYGGTLDVTTGLLTVDRANIASYSGETLPGAWISDRDVYAAGTTPTTGAQVVYELATPQTYQLTPTEVIMLLDDNTIWADTGKTTLTYQAYKNLVITDEDVMQGGFSIDRYACNGEKLEIGTAIASELKLKLNNSDGAFDDILFEGAELFVEIGIADWTQENPTISWIPCGYFTSDEQPRSLEFITINALDRMVNFDKFKDLTLKPWSTNTGAIVTDGYGNIIYFVQDVNLPCTVAQVVAQIASSCNVPFDQDLTGFPNADYVVSALPVINKETTFRNIIQWCAGLMGTNAWIDWEGKLRFSWFNNSTGYVSTTANRYGSDLYEDAVEITGVMFKDDDEDSTVYIAGTDEYALDLSSNGMIDAENATTILTNIYNAVHNFAYTPFSASVVAAPYLWPMDRVVFTDKHDAGHVSSLTNVNFGLNGTTKIQSNGKSAKSNSYAPTGMFTAGQRAVLKKLAGVTPSQMQEAVEHATEMITGGLGGYVVLNVNEETGETEEILIMDNPDKNLAVNVWRFNQGGLGHSSNGYNGPFNDVALTADGKINATMITTGTLNADVIRSGTISDFNGNNSWNLATGALIMTDGTIDIGDFEVDSTGKLTCTGADISGELHTTNVAGTYYIDIQGGELHAGKITNGTKTETGNLKFATITYEDNGYTYTNPGVQISSQEMMRLDTTKGMQIVSTGAFVDISAYYGATLHSENSGAGMYSGNARVNVWKDFGSWDGKVEIEGERIEIGLYDGYIHTNSEVIIGNDNSGYILLNGPIYVDYVASGYQGITGIYWTSQTGTQPLELNFRNGICVGVRRGV